MAPQLHEILASEYERQQIVLRGRAKKRVERWYWMTIVPYLGTWAAFLLPSVSRWVFLAAFGVAFVFAVATGIVTFRSWALLSWETRLFGLAPWAYFALVSLPFALDLIRG